MRLANGIVIDKEKTFGVLKFSALRREVHVQNEDGTVSEEIKERTYDLKCNTQGRMSVRRRGLCCAETTKASAGGNECPFRRTPEAQPGEGRVE